MSSKRKSNSGSVAAGLDLDDPAAKRRKLPSDNIDTSQAETPETTTQHGLKLVETIKKTEDKSGRVISTTFLTLPNRRQFPDYYKVIKMPIALDTIQEKLLRREFRNLTQLESYFKRMIANAKEYNQRGSEVYEDAERLRKALSNFMTKTNPAYKLIPGYAAVPTPLPGDGQASDPEDAEGEPDSDAEAEATVQVKKSRSRPKAQPKSKSHTPRRTNTPAAADSRAAKSGFSKLTFQQAQEKILEDLIAEKERPDDDFTTFEVFVDLPDRSLRDYYKIIQNPASLRSVQKKVKGSAGGSEFKTWAALEKEMKLIWNNAWKYNEDGSEISDLARELQTHFNKLFKEAKQSVQEPPPAPKIKLKVPEPAPKITLKFGSRGSPAAETTPAPQTNGANGTPANGTRRNPFGASGAPAPAPSLDQLERARSTSGSAQSPTPSNSGVVKNEEVARNSPAVSAAVANPRASSQTAVSTPGLPVMPPPSTPGVPANNMYSAGGYATSFQHQPQYQAPKPVTESRFRLPGKGKFHKSLSLLGAADAMITNLTIATHPGLNITRHFRMDLPPSETMAQQSITINLPHTHYYLQIRPMISPSLLQRYHKLFATSGAQRLHNISAIPGQQPDPQHPLFEARLVPGVNRIEIELIAALPKGTKGPNGQEAELEKISIFANLLKDPQQR
ncbi:hypothetical protein HYFRA_00012321 [Hymenoscyphus fraxineus]|uniref:Bromo domain-containing protein n=1 Tax=Hymenoscyphus fraxineus TaxID=746836 RepID=A0A9N9L1E7_9HELO|nr:hypothetical protein HYFRA_00012321 [Hymenoscyphus fraxineus]